MGMTISFTRVTPEQLVKAEQDPEWAEELLDELVEVEGEPDGDLDKAWAGIEYLMSEADVHVEFTMDGAMLDEEGTLFGWSVEDVQAMVEKLRAAPWEKLAVHYDAEKMLAADIYPRVWDMDGEIDYVEAHYRALVEFFEVTAASKSPAIMYFSF